MTLHSTSGYIQIQDAMWQHGRGPVKISSLLANTIGEFIETLNVQEVSLSTTLRWSWQGAVTTNSRVAVVIVWKWRSVATISQTARMNLMRWVAKTWYMERYKKWMPPITLRRDAIMPAQVNVSLSIHRVISIEEEHHWIKLQLEISLKWKDYRLTYYNLKPDLYLNTLSSEEMKRLWLPIVIYTNTEQLESTRLGENWEWTTNIWVRRENPIKLGYEWLDETWKYLLQKWFRNIVEISHKPIYMGGKKAVFLAPWR